jgi:hypothetical protein
MTVGSGIAPDLLDPSWLRISLGISIWHILADESARGLASSSLSEGITAGGEFHPALRTLFILLTHARGAVTTQ